MEQYPLTLGEVARRYGCTVQHVRRVFLRGFLPEPRRVGAYRTILPADLPAVEEALRKAGYIKEPAHVG